jgi:hypothetical protein
MLNHKISALANTGRGKNYKSPTYYGHGGAVLWCAFLCGAPLVLIKIVITY